MSAMQWAFFPWLYLTSWGFSGKAVSSRTKLIIDTDLFSDVDDAGALLLACTHDNVELLGVNINYPSVYTALAASAILGYYNRSEVALGVRRPISSETYFDSFTYNTSEYASKVAYHWQKYSALPWKSANSSWEPVQLYRKILSSQPDKSVKIASIGFLDNLFDLLSSEGDGFSPLCGSDLVSAKVNELVVMGGSYPSGHEYNFFGNDPEATAHVVNTWPTSITFLGDEVGHGVLSGRQLVNQAPQVDPVRSAYNWYNGGDTPRSSWDPLTLLYAIEGLGDMFLYGNDGGFNFVFPNGTNQWNFTDVGKTQHYLSLAVPDELAAQRLDSLFVEGAEKARRQGGGSKP